MKENRGSHGAGYLAGHVFAVGGGGLHHNLSSCEMVPRINPVFPEIVSVNGTLS